jgi:hypothetical protein
MYTQEFYMRISKSFVKDNAPTDGMVRVNHNENGCSGDSESCVIRNDGGRITAKCYRCGGWQVIDNDSFSPAKVASVIKREAQLPTDCVPALNNMPNEAIAWLDKAYFSRALCFKAGLQWSDKTSRLYIPARNIYQQWWVGRSFAPAEPRYKTLATLKDSCFAIAHANKDRLSDRIWIVEDLLSMYRVVEAGNDCMALCTTTISDKGVAMLSKLGYNKATISLDNDNPQVIMANSKIAQRLGWMKEVYRSDLSTDPKYYDPDELKERVK